MPKYQAPAGTMARGWTVALEPSPEQATQFRRDCGARAARPGAGVSGKNMKR